MNKPQPDVLIVLNDGSSVKEILIKDPGLLVGVTQASADHVTVFGYTGRSTYSPEIKGGLLTGTGEYKTK